MECGLYGYKQTKTTNVGLETSDDAIVQERTNFQLAHYQRSAIIEKIYIQKLTNRKREEKSSQESVRHPVVICITTGGETSDKNKVTTKQCKGMRKVNEEKFNHAKRVLQRKKE